MNDKNILVIDDEKDIRDSISGILNDEGYYSETVKNSQEALTKITDNTFDVIILDIWLKESKLDGIDILKQVKLNNPDIPVVIISGHGNIEIAVAAIKQGAIDYLAKPADADDVERALLADPNKKAAPPENPMSADRVKWEHIHRVFELCNRNVSETARRLKMHRRTLQRILSKRSPK